MTRKSKLLVSAMLAVLFLSPALLAEEIWLYDNSRIYGLVKGVSADKVVSIMLPTGDEKKVPMEEIIAVRFLGRNPLLIQSGTQEFRFVNGGSLRGQIQGNAGNMVQLQTAMAGRIAFDLSRVKGFVALPLAGFSGRKAEELVESDTAWVAGLVFPAMRDEKTGVILPEAVKMTRPVDITLDSRGSSYPGVARKFELASFTLDHEILLQQVPLKILYVAGVRMADIARDAVQPWAGDVQVRLWGRDDSRVQGHISRIHLGRWLLQPIWDVKGPLSVDLEEISLVQILGGRVQYLSQLTPVSVKESTVLAPPQPYRMDRSCQGDPISVAGKRYPWGIGVHADSELTFDLNGKFNEFRSDIGIATRMGERGSVIFRVLGDGKELYKSPVIRGSAAAGSTTQTEGQTAGKPVEVAVPVKGVKQLTLEVTNAGDLDLGDVANWGSARVLR
ncbi:MAG: NPCBM/NEW2 domain-containing protein [Phycisphaerae bacterium]|nr:NPCBM/NEW2 domain-containing protein [Phycisphaerae bacterium]